MVRKIVSVYMIMYLVMLGFAPIGSVYAQQQKTFTIGILNLDAKGVSQVEAEVLSEKLRSHITQLVHSDVYRDMTDKVRYEVIERQEMDKIFEQFDIQNVGCVSDSCAIEFGRMLQADRILLGTIGKVGNTYSVSARIIDLESSKAIANTDRQLRGSIDDVLDTVIPLVGDDLVLGKQKKKSKKMWYILAGVVIAGAGAGAALMGGGGDDGGEPAPAMLPLPPSRP